MQDFIWQTQHLGSGNAKLPGAPVDKATAQQHGNQALDGLRTLGTLLISNGQFRKLRKCSTGCHYLLVLIEDTVSDATILLRDIAGDAAQNAATRINPSEDLLNQIDEPAEENTWHEVPKLSPTDLRAQAKGRFNQAKQSSKAGGQDVAGDATAAAHPAGSRDPADAANLAAQDQQQGTNSGLDPQSGGQAAVNNLRATASDKVPEEHKEKARNLQNKTRSYLDEKVSKERRDRTIYRLKKMVVEIQSHSDC